MVVHVYKFILALFATYISASVITLAVVYNVVLPQHEQSTKQIVSALIYDIDASEYSGAMSVVAGCNERGYVFISDNNSTSGRFMDCANAKVHEVGQNDVQRLANDIHRVRIPNEVSN